jgi:hypothetical protein
MPRRRRRKLLSAALVFYSIAISDLPPCGPPSHQNNDVEMKNILIFYIR